ncbi:MAG TPA: hypothetical protein VHF47_10490 [Acidimicrobiales bacterium]|nr:hypothetical protein [Acidimicrobiales bacterium]
MTVTEQARHRLYAHLEEIMGEEHAAALTEWLPDGPLASKADIDDLRAATKADIEGLRAATKADIEGLRADIDHLRAATKADIDHLREVMDIRWEQTATKAEVLTGLAGLQVEMHKGFTRQTWGLVTAVSVVNGLMLGALRLV